MTDQTTTIQQLKDKVHKFREERGWSWTDQKDIAISICLEAAELLEHFQWVTTDEVKDNAKWKQAVGEEMVDVVYLVLEMADHFEIDLATAFEDKGVKQARKYPVELFNPAKSQEEQMRAYHQVKAKTRTNYPFVENRDKV